MQETRIQSLAQEDPDSVPGPRAAGQLSPSTATTEPCPRARSRNDGIRVFQLLQPEHCRACAQQQEKLQRRKACPLQLEQSPHSNKDPAQSNKFID